MTDPPPDPPRWPIDSALPDGSERRGLDRRTIGICVCVALLAALAAGLITSVVLSKSDANQTQSGAASDIANVFDRAAHGSLKKVDPKAVTAVPTDPIERLTTGTFSLGGMRGKPIVVNFFSSTCQPCVKEMPGLERLHQELGDKVAFVGIDLQDTKAQGQGLVQLTGVTYEIGYDPQGNLLRAVAGQALPTTALVAADGRLVTMHTGALEPTALRQLLVDHQLLPA